MKAIAVIGSSWGDEGKGAAVDKLAYINPNSLIVRFNGGGQAGHTVVLPDGRKHIFSHFCSGVLACTPGHLSEYFVVNPRIFVNELEELRRKFGIFTYLTVDPKALVTTPLDVAFNRAMETKRGAGRHGSVGIGFGETIERSERGFPLFAEDLYDPHELERKVNRIIHEWGHLRATELDLIRSDVEGNYPVEGFMQECATFISNVGISLLKEASRGRDTIIFEGAQGLLLDQRRGVTFPYVTRSNTGVQNVIPLLNQLGIKELKAIYMMRPYLTRHGAGPLPGEVEKLPFEIKDETNTTKPWQEHLRFAPMNTDLIRDAIATDLRDAHPFNVKPYIGISCVDQVRASDVWDVLRGIKHPLAINGNGPSRDKYRLSRDFYPSKSTKLVGSQNVDVDNSPERSAGVLDVSHNS